MDLQQAITYNARVNEKEHAKLDNKIKEVSDTLNERINEIELTPGPQGEKGDTVVGPQGPKGDKGDSIVGPPGKDGKRGNLFIGIFETEKDLPEIDNINVKKGDWAYIDSTGEIWYA